MTVFRIRNIDASSLLFSSRADVSDRRRNGVFHPVYFPLAESKRFSPINATCDTQFWRELSQWANFRCGCPFAVSECEFPNENSEVDDWRVHSFVLVHNLNFFYQFNFQTESFSVIYILRESYCVGHSWRVWRDSEGAGVTLLRMGVDCCLSAQDPRGYRTLNQVCRPPVHVQIYVAIKLQSQQLRGAFITDAGEERDSSATDGQILPRNESQI